MKGLPLSLLEEKNRPWLSCGRHPKQRFNDLTMAMSEIVRMTAIGQL